MRTRACSRTSIARTRQAALTHNVRGKELRSSNMFPSRTNLAICLEGIRGKFVNAGGKLSVSRAYSISKKGPALKYWFVFCI